MSWRDRFLVGSFKGAEFKLDEHELSQSRSIVTHEFPGSESHYSQDLGKRPKAYAIRAYILGQDYDLQRDRFLAACSSPGPGELIHPHFGSLQVHCQSIAIRESRSELQIARLELSFIEVGVNLFPSPELKRKDAVLSAAEKAREASNSSFLKSFNLSGSIESVRQAEAFLSKQLEIFAALEREVNQIYALDAAASIAASTARELLNAPQELLDTCSTAMSRITGQRGNLYAIQSLKSLAESYAQNLSGATAADKSPTAQLNFMLYKESIFVRSESLSAILEVPAAVIVPESGYREALSGVITDLDLALSRIISYDEYRILSDFKSVLISLSESKDVYALPDLKSYLVPYDMPLSIAAFKIFGSTDRAAELQKLNQIIDPIIIPKDTFLSYLDG